MEKGKRKLYNHIPNEKLAIIDAPDKNLLNQRSEVTSQSSHRSKLNLTLSLSKLFNFQEMPNLNVCGQIYMNKKKSKFIKITNISLPFISFVNV